MCHAEKERSFSHTAVEQEVLVTAKECKCAFKKKMFLVVTAHSAHKNIYDCESLIDTGMSNAFCSALHQAH